MAIAYVVMETSFEYNDEIYHTGESPGGNPFKVFRKRDVAEKEAAKKSKDFFTNSLSFRSLAYEESEIFVGDWKRMYLAFEGGEDALKTSEVMEEGLPDIFESEEEGREFIEKMTDEQFAFFLKNCYCGTEPFSVSEVDLED
jgi:hypothetical protein